MSSLPPGVSVVGLACEPGDLQRTPETIENFSQLCADRGLSLSLTTMGCGTFFQMTKPVAGYVVRAARQTLRASGTPAAAVDAVVFATTDQNLRALDEGFTRQVLQEVELTNATPTLVSFRQCASSLAALEYGAKSFHDERTQNVLLVAFDFVAEDADRIKPFALFGDAVTSCMLKREPAAGLRLISCSINVDFAGLTGRDSFQSREQAASATLDSVLAEGRATKAEIEKVFSTNVYKPLAMFGADICRIPRARLYMETLRELAHCGNCDWMLNLLHYQERHGITAGKKYVVQAPTPGFFACALLEARA